MESYFNILLVPDFTSIKFKVVFIQVINISKLFIIIINKQLIIIIIIIIIIDFIYFIILIITKLLMEVCIIDYYLLKNVNFMKVHWVKITMADIMVIINLL